MKVYPLPPTAIGIVAEAEKPASGGMVLVLAWATSGACGRGTKGALSHAVRIETPTTMTYPDAKYKRGIMLGVVAEQS
jgi:hypothetical protein